MLDLEIWRYPHKICNIIYPKPIANEFILTNQIRYLNPVTEYVLLFFEKLK